MAIALVSDVHSNIEALTAVLKDIKEQGIEEIACLGDLVGYGPNPSEIVETAQEWKFSVMGNHDEAVLKEAYGFNPVAKAAVTWTRDQIKPRFLAGIRKRRTGTFLRTLPRS